MSEIGNIHINTNNMMVDIRFDKLNERMARAQYYLDSQIMNDMVPLMPRNQGNFINATRARSQAWAGTGKVCAGIEPMGHYLYKGVKYVNARTGKGARPLNINGELIFRHVYGARLIPTDIPLHYTSPTARPEWFEVAKRNYSKEWINGVKKIIGGK